MASVYTFAIVLIGLNVLLLLAGIQGGTGFLMDKFVNTSVDPASGNISIDYSPLNSADSSGSSPLNTLMALFGIAALFSVGVALATKDAGQGIKAGLAVLILASAIDTFIGLILLGNNYSDIGSVITKVAMVIYIPLIVGFIITAANWIGGGQ